MHNERSSTYAPETSGERILKHPARARIAQNCFGRICRLSHWCTPAALREHGEALVYGRISFGSSCVALIVNFSTSAAIMRVVLWQPAWKEADFRKKYFSTHSETRSIYSHCSNAARLPPALPLLPH